MNNYILELLESAGLTANGIDESSDLYLEHYGMPRRSGRYPWGSGDNPYQHSGDFLARVEELHKQGLTEKQIADEMKISTGDLRALKQIAKNERRAIERAKAQDLEAKGYSRAEIARMMGYNSESSIRNLLNDDADARRNAAAQTADFLREQIDKYGMIDVGAGVDTQLGISSTKMKEALDILGLEGYEVYSGGVQQVTNPGKQTILKVACRPGTEHKEIYNYENVHEVNEDFVSHDGGDTFDPKWVYPKSMDSSRLAIRYGDEGGSDKDGVIEIRRGVEDLDLGNSHYAQVRILVDGTHYIKGMAMYSDDVPEGYDILFNTNKSSDKSKLEVLKPITKDPDNPFGSLIKEGINDPTDPATAKERGGQSYYIDKDGNKQLSLINKRAEEGDWEDWSNKLPSQFLAKQSLGMVRQQLKQATDEKQAEFDELCACTNPTLKRKMLMTFADDCDSSAVHLKAASLPGQKYQVILPLKSIKDDEVYAPNFKDGETVALVRFPHAGTFEIPILRVNNKQPEGKKNIGPDATDAIGINSKVAARLSGADFDGDTVMVVPCNSEYTKTKVTSTPPLRGLEGFDPHSEYGPGKTTVDAKGKEHYYRNGKEYKIMSKQYTQQQMGIVSNLISDMDLKGATDDEKAKAVRHSMVVIDANKHKLDYRQSEIDNDIAALKRKYQGHIGPDGKYHEGASSIISQAKAKQDVPKRRGAPQIDPDTGEVSYKLAKDKDLYYTGKDGKIHMRTQASTRMAETRDAFTLLSDSDNPKEKEYAKYANEMKALGRKARVEALKTPSLKYNPSSAVTYKNEVKSLKSQLEQARLNAPRERRAQMLANSRVQAKVRADEDLKNNKAEKKKLAQRELAAARVETGAKRHPIDISGREWEAIQAGAIHDTTLAKILDYADTEQLRQRATPRASTQLTQAKQSKIQAMKASGYTTAQIAEAVGVSTSTVHKYLND